MKGIDVIRGISKVKQTIIVRGEFGKALEIELSDGGIESITLQMVIIGKPDQFFSVTSLASLRDFRDLLMVAVKTLDELEE